MASFPGLCRSVGAAEEDGEQDDSLQQMLKAIADERNRLNARQEISGLGKSAVTGRSLYCLCFLPTDIMFLTQSRVFQTSHSDVGPCRRPGGH